MLRERGVDRRERVGSLPGGERVLDEHAQHDLVGRIGEVELALPDRRERRVRTRRGAFDAGQLGGAGCLPPGSWISALRRGAGVVPLLERDERAHADDVDVGRLAAGPLHGHARELDRLGPLAALVVDAREHARRLGGGVVDAHGLAQLRDRAVEVAELARGESRQVASAGVVGPVADALLERLERRLRIAALELDAAADQLRVGRLLELLGHASRRGRAGRGR